MKTFKPNLFYWFCLAVLQSCGHDDSRRYAHNLNADPKKLTLELIDSLITHGEHRKALAILDSFQRHGNEEIYLIQSELLWYHALDSLYRE